MFETQNEQIDTKPQAPVELPPVIRGAMLSLKAAQEKYDRFAGLIEAARQEKAQAEQDHAEAFSKLAADEAGVAADGAAANPALKKAASRAQEVMMVCAARIQGLGVRQQQARADVDAAMRELSQATATWRNAFLDEAKREYREITGRFVELIERPIAVGIALGDPHTAAIARTLVLPDLDSIGKSPFEVRGWKDNPRMMAVIKEIAEIRRVCDDAMTGARLAVMQLQ